MKAAATAVVLASVTALAYVQPVPALERITPDKWHPEIQQPQFDLKRNQSLYPQGELVLTQAQRPEKVTPDRWQPLGNQPRFDLKRWQYTYPFAVAPERQPKPPADSWLPEANQPRFDIGRRQYLYQPFASDGVPRAELVSADRWHPQIEQPRFDLKRQQAIYPSLAAPDRQPSLAIISEWFTESYIPRTVHRTLTGDSGGFVTVVASGEVVTADKWYHLPGEPARLADNRGYITVGDLVLTAAQRPEKVTPDRWHLQINSPQFDLTRSQYLHPHLFFDPFPRPPSGETVTVDKWYQLPSNPQFNLSRIQYIYPCFISDGVPRKETVSLDRWHPSINQPVFNNRYWQAWFPFLSLTNLVTVAPVNVGMWHPEIQLPIFDIKRTQWIYPSSFQNLPSPLQLLRHEAIGRAGTVQTQLNIRTEIQRIRAFARGPLSTDRNLANALSAIQDNANSVDTFLSDLEARLKKLES